MISSLMVLTKLVSPGGIVTNTSIIDVLFVSILVWVLLNRKVSVTGHEVPVPGGTLALACILNVGVLLWQHGVASHVIVGLGDHGWVGLQVGPVVPFVVVPHVSVCHVCGEEEAADGRSEISVILEVAARLVAWVKVVEILHEAVEMHDGDASSSLLHATAKHAGNRPGDRGANSHV